MVRTCCAIAFWNMCFTMAVLALIMVAAIPGRPETCQSAASEDNTASVNRSTVNPVAKPKPDAPAFKPPATDSNGGRIEEVPRRGVDWQGVLAQSALFLSIEQGYRLGTQPGTRDALKGRFFDDWFHSIKATHGWGDEDDFLTNYIGHPMEGSVAGNIFVQNDPVGRNCTFAWDSVYWHSRLKASAWVVFYSTQFELGPFSEASIGNVGHHGASLSGAVDLVVTPLAGLGWQVGEDVIDKYLITWIESRTSNRVIRMFARGVLNPTRSFANVMRLKVPWTRDTRPGVWRPR